MAQGNDGGRPRTKQALRTLAVFGPGLDQQPDQPDLLDLSDPGPVPRQDRSVY